MSVTDKSTEGTDGFVYDPVLGYRIQQSPNEATYQQTTVRRLQIDGEQEVPLTRSTLFATCGFLLAVLLVGFFAGYSTRGNAYAGNNTASLVASAMIAVPPAAGLDTRSTSSQLVASFGTEAPDELLSFGTDADGTMTALVRLHDTGARRSDMLSFMEIAQNGSVTELFRQDAIGAAKTSMARLDDGRFVTASMHDGQMALNGWTADGESGWTRKVNALSAHQANVSVVATKDGIAIVGPAEQADRISAIFLSHDGDLLWQRSLEADSTRPDLNLLASPDGSILIILQNPQSDVGASHTLKRIDSSGQDMWTMPIELGSDSNLAGFAPTGDGGAYLLSAGDFSSLTRLDSSGVVDWDILIPEAQLFSDINLMAASNGDAIVTISYALGADSVDIWGKRHNRFGELVGEMNMELPGLSQVASITEAAGDNFLVAGSVLPNRFEDTDIFVKGFSFRRVARPAQIASAAVAPPAESDVSETVMVTLPEPEIAPVRVPARTVVASPEPALETPLATLEITDQPAGEVATSGFLDVDDSVVETLAPTVEPLVRGQCRFTCLEHDNPSASFPMWRAVEAVQGDFDTGLRSQHDLTCRSAGGLTSPSSPPACQGF